MNIVAATVTVYFVGLVNFYPGSRPGREVILPVALKGSGVKHQEEELKGHQAMIWIPGDSLSTGSTGCGNLGGTWDDPNPATTGDEFCSVTLTGFGKTVSLDTPTGPFVEDAAFGKVPKISNLCCAITGIDSDYWTDDTKYAARMWIENGTLSACTHNREWVSSLNVGTTGLLKITDRSGTKSANLVNNGKFTISHEMDDAAGVGWEEHRHFWWFYKMYVNAEKCTAVPSVPNPPAPCSGIPMPMIHTFASGVGCSNSAYP